MKASLVKEQTLRNYALKHAESRTSIAEFIQKVRGADWKYPEDMKHTFSSVDILGKGSNRNVFNIGGNNHRLICKYRFGRKTVRLYVLWIGTHAEYTTLCNKGEQFYAKNFEVYS